MSNHVHLVLRPERSDSLALFLRRAHGEYSQRFNRRHSRTGHLWQNRYYSCPMERTHAWNALRYVDLNPVRAGLVTDACQWRWSSAKAHHNRATDEFGLLQMEWLEWRDWPDWEEYLQLSDPEQEAQLRKYTRLSLPLGSDGFIRSCEQSSGRVLATRPPGRPRNVSVVGSGGRLTPYPGK